MVDSTSLTVKNLACVRNERVLFHGLNFSLNPGEILHVQGANGVGKSSLLRILCGLLEPAQGEIFWQGQLTFEDPIAFRRDLGYLGHKLGLKERLTALENVQLFFEGDSHRKQDTKSQFRTISNAESALERLGVAALKNQFCETLSAGQKQRVALARLLARNAQLWLLDEPFTAVDAAGVTELESLIQEHVQGGGLVILTSHQPIKLKDLSLQQLQLS